MKFFRETEKAVELEMRIELTGTEKLIAKKIWIPKSQIKDGKLTKWIANQKIEDEKRNFHGEFFATFCDADGETVETAVTENEKKRFAKAEKSFAKACANIFGK